MTACIRLGMFSDMRVLTLWVGEGGNIGRGGILGWGEEIKGLKSENRTRCTGGKCT